MLNNKTQIKEGLFFVPMGGCGEIGRNLNFFGIKKQEQEQWIIVDAGISIQRKLGLQVIYSSMGSMRNKNITAIVCTHAHDDHIGAIPFIIQELNFKVPIYATAFTMLLLKEKLKEKKILEKCKLIEISTANKFNIGPFNIEFIYVTHSLPEPNMIKINTEFGTIVHTGDWKFDSQPVVGDVTDYKYLENLGNQGQIDYLICDSTNALEKNRTKSEGEAAENLRKHILKNNHRKKIIISCISSNVARIQTLFNIAKEAKRKVIFLGFSLDRITNIANQLNYLDDFNLLQEKSSIHGSQENLLIICTGSQGEPNSGLDKIANGIHRYLKIAKGDLVIFSARVIPGNEVDVNRIKNQLSVMNVDILDTSMDPSIHVSGHPSEVEVKELMGYLKPKNLIPVHGDHIRLKKMSLIGKSLNIPTIIPFNGIKIHLDRKKPSIIGKLTAEIIGVDGAYPVNINNELFVERQELAENGIAIITIINKKINFRLVGINKICLKSFKVFLEKNKHNHEDIEKHIHFFFYEYYKKLPKIVVQRF